MNKWALSDWANAWKNPIPTKVQDSNGIEVMLSDEQILEIKAQLDKILERLLILRILKM